MEYIQNGIPLVAAHRGAAGGNIPCNSESAFKAALFQGADIIELDAALSRERDLFVFHPMMEFAQLSNPAPLRLLSSKQIKKRRYVNQDKAKTNERILTLDEAFELLKNKCVVNIDKFWTAPAEISNTIRRHKMEDQVIVKTPAKEKYFSAVECIAPDLPYMVMVHERDDVSDRLLKRKINFIGIEAVFKSDDSPVVGDEHISYLHKNGLAIWGNAIVYNMKDIIAAEHTDDVSMRGDPDLGWGWFAKKGFDIVQTDWTLPMKTYFEKNYR